MIASVYIKDGNIHIYNEGTSLSGIGGLAYELGRPLLDFVCYEHDRFDESFAMIADAFNNEYAHMAIQEPEFVSELRQLMSETQQREVYVYFYHQMLMDFIYTFIESPRMAIKQLNSVIPGSEEKLRWTVGFEWPSPPPGKVFADRERRLNRAAIDVIALMSNHLKLAQRAMITETELLISLREKVDIPISSSMDYLYMLEVYHHEHSGRFIYLDNPFRAFYGVTKPPEIVELYEINTIADLSRFEFVKMIEHDIFIKKCKNCERFFIPRRRADAEYCDRLYGDTNRKCSEIGAMLRYERKVAENPILEAHKKAYRRFHSRVRTKKMTQSEFMRWSDEASSKRDECLAGNLSYDDFVVWLEQGRVRKARRGGDVRG